MKIPAPDPIETTIRHYETHAGVFRDRTLGHDVSQNYAAFLSELPDGGPLRLLDLGCGPGRDLRYLRGIGHDPVGLDAAIPFTEMARSYSGCEVWCQNFLSLDLPEREFHGIFANAVLFHIPRSEILRVLGQLGASLKGNGVLFSSNPRGNDEEMMIQGRFGVFYRDETWLSLVPQAGFEPIRHYRRPTGEPEHRQPWLASVWRWPGSAHEAISAS